MADQSGVEKGWLWYAYGVRRASAPLPSVVGIDGREVVPVIRDSLCGLASLIPPGTLPGLAQTGADRDITWVGRQAFAHEAVLAAAFQTGPVLPLRFGAVYRSADRLAQFLARHSEALLAEIDRLEHHAEWSVKALADRAALERWAAKSDAALEESPPESEGHAYFARRRAQERIARDRERIAREMAVDVHERLAGIAVDALTSRPQDRALSGYNEDMVLNGIYLTHDAALAAFRSEIASLEGRYAPAGFQLVVTGPWPPHHFVDVEAFDDRLPLRSAP